jgi:hypothetical protein
MKQSRIPVARALPVLPLLQFHHENTQPADIVPHGLLAVHLSDRPSTNFYPVAREILSGFAKPSMMRFQGGQLIAAA